MRRIEVFREGNAMGAMIGPDLVVGLSGFGETAADALRDLADEFEETRLIRLTSQRRGCGSLGQTREC